LALIDQEKKGDTKESTSTDAESMDQDAVSCSFSYSIRSSILTN